MNNNNTIIENVEYLDMDDIKNSWYFDAEKFDVNFPLVRSYKGGVDQCHVRGLLSDWYEYWDAVFSYYSAMPNVFGICFTMDTPTVLGNVSDSFNIFEDSVYTESRFRISSRVSDSFSDRKLFLYSKQCLLNGKIITYALAVVRGNGSLVDLKKKLLQSLFYSRTDMGFVPSYPHSQLMISRDWDLLKRYFFFMIRNHQYKGSKFIYTVSINKRENTDISAFTDLYEGAAFSELPEDYRFGWSLPFENSVIEAHEVVVTDRKLTQKDLE